MPRGEMPWIRDGRLLNGTRAGIVINSPAWFKWLATVTSFCYSSQCSSVRLTVRYEKRGSRFYWYAYSKIDRKLHNVYLGCSANLTQRRLEAAAHQVYQRAKERRVSANNELRSNAIDNR